MSTTTQATAKKAKPKKVATEINARTLRAVKMLSKAREDAKVVKDRADRAEAIIREALGDAEVGTVAGLKVVEIMLSSSVKWDTDTMAVRWPEALTTCKKLNPYTWVKTV